jgi:hypothetical protein
MNDYMQDYEAMKICIVISTIAVVVLVIITKWILKCLTVSPYDRATGTDGFKKD